MRSEAHQFQKRRNTLAQPRHRHAAQSPVKLQQFRRGQPRIETEIFRQEADLASNFDIIGRSAQNKRLPAAGLHKSQQHFDGSAFPRTIGSEETKNFAATHRQSKIAYRNLVPKLLAQIYSVDRKVRRVVQMDLRAP